MVPGGHVYPYGLKSIQPDGFNILVESEMDALLGLQLQPACGWVALPATKRLDPKFLPSSASLIIARDCDDPGRAAAQRDQEQYPQATLAPDLPTGFKDLTDYATRMGETAAKQWIDDAIDNAIGEVDY